MPERKGLRGDTTGKIDAAKMSFPNLIDDIILTMKRQGFQIFSHKPCRTNAGTTAISLLISFYALPSQLKCKTSLMDVPFAVTEAELLTELGWNL